VIWFLLAVILAQPLVAFGWYRIGTVHGVRIADRQHEADLIAVLDSVSSKRGGGRG
jgi:hypothetical protein